MLWLIYVYGRGKKSMTLDKTKVLVPQGFSVANDDLKFKKGLQ